MSTEPAQAAVRRPSSPRPVTVRPPSRPGGRVTGRYGRDQLPGRTIQHAAAPALRVRGGPAAVAPVQVADTPADVVRPGPPALFRTDDVLEAIARVEIVRLRERYGRPSGGQWAVLYDPVRRRWIALRGKTQIQTAGTPAALEPLIDSA